jgi:hypothetical protein
MIYTEPQLALIDALGDFVPQGDTLVDLDALRTASKGEGKGKGKGKPVAVAEEPVAVAVAEEPVAVAAFRFLSNTLYSSVEGSELEAIRSALSGERRVDTALARTIVFSDRLGKALAGLDDKGLKAILNCADARNAQSFAKVTLSGFATRSYSGKVWSYGNGVIAAGAEVARRAGVKPTIGAAIAFAVAGSGRNFRGDWSLRKYVEQFGVVSDCYAVSGSNRGLWLLK